MPQLGCDLPYFREAAETRDFAQAAEELGYDVLNFSEHVAATTDSPFPPGFTFGDPWHESMTLAAFLAGVTRRIEISTSMYLLPLRPTVLAAKQAAEVDLLTRGKTPARRGRRLERARSPDPRAGSTHSGHAVRGTDRGAPSTVDPG
ncbi:Luciferase-like monooxygenase [Prauserella aidingensis]|uniref:LLM class flavin-dependent oxidoreductase n=1 Tax=Prauserella aidingensis TaxID=387890 RepID=UPI003556B903|nr:Luciferase-like monooxygenase [Prauserella aidingensis]